MKINTKILQAINEGLYDSQLIKDIEIILDSHHGELTNKDNINVPYIGSYRKSDEHKKFYDSYGISEANVNNARKLIEKNIQDKFNSFGYVAPETLACYYVPNKNGKETFYGVNGKFSLYIGLNIRIFYGLDLQVVTDKNYNVSINFRITYPDKPMGKNIVIFNAEDIRNLQRAFSSNGRLTKFFKDYPNYF